MKNATLLVALATFALAGAVHAEVLWDQSAYDPFGAGLYNSVSGSPPLGITAYSVCDVHVGETWNMDGMTTWFTLIDGGWGTGITQGHIHVFPKVGSLPINGTDDPAASVVVPMNATVDGSSWRVHAAGFSIPLAPGDYWIGMTPIAPSGPFGPEINLSTTAHFGDDSPTLDPFDFIGGPGWFVLTPGVDATLQIEGSRPTSVDSRTWAGIKAIYR
jgi:hypothetical protein